MLRRRKLKVDNSDPRARLQGGREIVEEGIGLGYLVIQVHEDRGIQRGSGQARVVWFAEREFDVRQLQKFCSPGELDEVIPRDVLGNDRAGGSDEVNAFPYRTATGALLDSGNYQEAVARAVEQGRLAELKAKRDAARAEGRLYGIGFTAVVEPSVSNMGYITTVLTAAECRKAGPKNGAQATATVGLDPVGSVTVHVASVPQGQGHRTVLSQVVADVFGLQPRDVYGQGIYIDPRAEMVIARYASHPMAGNAANDPVTLPAYMALAKALMAGG